MQTRLMREGSIALRRQNVGWGLPLAVLALLATILLGVLTFAAATWWVWGICITWLMLSLIAALGQCDAPSRGFITGTLKKRRFMHFYDAVAPRWLGLIWTRLCDPVPDEAGVVRTFWGALTWRLYDRAAFLSIAYPIGFLALWWIITGQAQLGTEDIIPPAEFFWQRAGLLMVIILLILTRVIGRMPRLERIEFFVPFIVLGAAMLWVTQAGGGIFGLIVVGIGCVALFDFKGLTGIAIGLSSCMALVGVNADIAPNWLVVGLFAGFSGGIAFLAEYASDKGHGREANAILTLLLPVVWFTILASADLSDISPVNRSFLIFFGTLPLINALFDVVSYAVTLTLMKYGKRQPFLFGVLDFAVAFVLFLALGITLTLVIAGMNRLTGVVFVDFGALFAGLAVAPHDYWWLFAMVFSTILPTALHGAVALFGTQGLVPFAIRRPVARLMDTAPATEWKAALAPLAVGLLWSLPFLAIALVLTMVWYLCDDALAWAGGFYLSVLLETAVWIGEI